MSSNKSTSTMSPSCLRPEACLENPCIELSTNDRQNDADNRRRLHQTEMQITAVLYECLSDVDVDVGDAVEPQRPTVLR